MKNKIFFFIGTKAQLIKTAPIMKIFEEKKKPYRFIFTGQHNETIDELLRSFGIKKPDITLHKGEDIAERGKMFFWLIKILRLIFFNQKEIFGDTKKEDIVLIHGDTISTLLGAIAGRLSGIRVGHVESGLRSFRLFHPFPEEIIRRIVFALSDIYFCPNECLAKNLEKYSGEKIILGENTLLDAIKLVEKSETSDEEIPKEKFFICSIHRHENIFSKRIFFLVDLLRDIAKNNIIIFVLHPATTKQLKKTGLFQKLESEKNIILRPRSDYFSFLRIVKKSSGLLTDGGSNQEECAYLGIPCLLLRSASERTEGMSENVVLSDYKKGVIFDFINNSEKYRRQEKNIDFSPSERVFNALEK